MWTQVVARTSVWYGVKLWTGRLCGMVWTQVVNRTSVWYGVDSSCGQDVCVVWCGLKLWTGRLCGMVWTQAVARTSVWYGVDSSSEQDVCVVWCGLKLWPGRLCGMEWTQVVARTSVCVDSSCCQDVCVVWCGLKLWPGRLCVWTQVVGTTSVCVDSSCGQVVKPRGYLSCTHVTLTLVCHVRWSALPAHTWHFLQTSAYQRSDLILTTLKASHRMNLLRAHVLSSCSMDHDSCGTLTPDPICDVPCVQWTRIHVSLSPVIPAVMSHRVQWTRIHVTLSPMIPAVMSHCVQWTMIHVTLWPLIPAVMSYRVQSTMIHVTLWPLIPAVMSYRVQWTMIHVTMWPLRDTVTVDCSCDVSSCSVDHDSRNTVTVDCSCDVPSCSMNHGSYDVSLWLTPVNMCIISLVTNVTVPRSTCFMQVVPQTSPSRPRCVGCISIIVLTCQTRNSPLKSQAVAKTSCYRLHRRESGRG